MNNKSMSFRIVCEIPAMKETCMQYLTWLDVHSESLLHIRVHTLLTQI